MKSTSIGWLLFFGGFGLELIIDHLMRLRDGDVTNGGLPSSLWNGIQLMLLIGAVALLYRGAKPLGRVVGAVAILLQLMVGYVLYNLAFLWYVVETGIDSL